MPLMIQRPAQLAVLIFSLCVFLLEVQCWSLFGEGDGGDDGGGDGDDTIRRTLTSFQQQEYAHTIPNDKPITPRGRRDVESSVKAHTWPTTIFSPLCEAWAYFDAGESIGEKQSSSKTKEKSNNSISNDYSLAWRYLDILVEKGGISDLDSWVTEQDTTQQDVVWTFQNSTEIALEVASLASKSSSSSPSDTVASSTPLDSNLLPMSLSLRAHSPHCEMHRTLARNAAISFGLYNIDDNRKAGSGSTTQIPAAFIVISRVVKTDSGSDAVVGSHVLLDSSLLSAAIDTLKSNEDDVKGDAAEGKNSRLLMQLSDETFHPKTIATKGNDDDIVAILYGLVGTTAFASLYQSLKDSQIKFVVRHMGYVPYEETRTRKVTSSRAIPTVLQGYGVRLDIRNLEYKAFDEGSDDKSKDGVAEVDVLDSSHHPDHPARNEYLAGVNLNKVLGRLQDDVDANTASLPSDLQSLQTALLQSHPTQLSSESIVPPAWQRRPLSLQAATVIAASSDPLATLQGVSQNLPSVAHSLANVNVPESFNELAEEASSLASKVGAVSSGWGNAAFGLFINSRPVDVERPSFNVFQMLNEIRAEDRRLNQLELKVRPVLTNALSMLGGGKKDSAADEWEREALQATRKIFDLGTDELKKMGKQGNEDNNSLENEQSDHAGYGEEEDTSEKFRVDVARGGKNAVLYLNDIEKDPIYKSWPTSMEEMLYRSQFGGAPTVRRNLFTMLIVFDPSNNTSPRAFSILGQLLNSQFPIRIGVLIVNEEDVSKGIASQVEPWNGGSRNFNARDSFLLLKHISKKYGSMSSISCLVQVSQDIAESEDDLSINEYVGMHLSLLLEMGVLQSSQRTTAQNEIDALLKSGNSDTSDKPNGSTYEAAVQFAVDKLIRPGMSFFNGLPLPTDSSDSFQAGVNDILSYENRNIMKLVTSGVISDSKPARSIYATVLKGDKVYKQYHPLLTESDAGEYIAISHTSTWQSLIFPASVTTKADYNNIDSIFVVEGVFDLDSPVGIDATLSFLDLMMSSSPDTWHDSKSASLAFRVLPSSLPTLPISEVLTKFFCHASLFDVQGLRTIVKALHDGDTSYDTISDVIASIGQIKDINGEMLEKMIDVAKIETSCPVARSTAQEDKNFYVANGKIYVPVGDNASIRASDISMLINMEMDRTHAITKLILPHFLSRVTDTDETKNDIIIHHAVGTLSAVLNEAMSSSSSSSTKIQDIASIFGSLQRNDNPLYFSWNEDSYSTSHLQVKVSIILDPLTEPTQRVAPLLIAIRDVLKLPLQLVIAPRQVVNNDVPISSYYRFVADPIATNPAAIFQNLPTNHVLTLRMDVPELWDVQQASAIQDSDNLRCDPRLGCGDEAGESNQEGIEKTSIEYELKSLLLFGQCYDVKKSSPPNGLKLTLDRARTDGVETDNSQSTAEVLPDGSQHVSEFNQIVTKQKDHTDTLVMKTAGYWQLRASPGVWDLSIAEKSRGAEMYRMVEGTFLKTGKIQLSKKDASENTSKTLVMNSFVNQGRLLLVNRRKGYEDASLFDVVDTTQDKEENETVHIFSLASGHAYERLLKIMMLSVTKRTSSPVKFWLFENVSNSLLHPNSIRIKSNQTFGYLTICLAIL